MATEYLSQKESYSELTPKQASVVDAKVDNKSADPQEVAEIASDLLDGDETVSQSYVNMILAEYSDLIQDRRDQTEQAMADDPYDTLEESHPVQTFGDGSESVETHSIDMDTTIEKSLTRSDIEALINQNVPDQLRDELISDVLDKAFE